MANADLDIPEMITQLHELQRVSRETYSVQKELIDYNDNLNTTSFMSAPGYGGMPRTGPSPRTQSIASMQIAQQVSKPMSPMGGVLSKVGTEAALEGSHHFRSLRSEVHIFRHLAEPILMGGKFGVGTLRGGLHLAAQAGIPGVGGLLSSLAVGGIFASMITELVRNRVEKQIKETETYTNLTKAITEKFKYDPQTVNKWTASLRDTHATWRTEHYLPGTSEPGSALEGLIPVPRRAIDPNNVERYVENRKKRTEAEVNELGLQVANEIEKRRKYVMKFYGYDEVIKRAHSLSKKPLNEIGIDEITLAKDSFINEKLYNITAVNKEGVEEEKIKFMDAKFDADFAEQIAMEEKLKALKERLEEEAANVSRRRMEQENIGKLAEALKQQYALEDSNWTEI